MGNEAASLPALLGGIAWPAGAPPIAVQPLPWPAAHEKLLTGFAGGSLPSVGQVGNSWSAELAAIGTPPPVPAYASSLTPAPIGAVVEPNPLQGQTWGGPRSSIKTDKRP